MLGLVDRDRDVLYNISSWVNSSEPLGDVARSLNKGAPRLASLLTPIAIAIATALMTMMAMIAETRDPVRGNHGDVILQEVTAEEEKDGQV